jgi:dipeptidyl aminopeptidase/acylaminoacyl peptidase
MGRRSMAVAAFAAAGVITVGPAAATRSATPLSVVFERVTAAGNADVVVTNENGKPQRNVTLKSTANESSPAFSPTGKSIVFTTDRKGRFTLWTMNADGTKQRQLTPSGGSDVNPIYSPDGRWIAFACSAHGNWDICVVTSRGTGRRNLTHDSAVELDPSWSPDSKQVVFDRIVGQKSDIWTVSPKGGTALDITPGTALNELDPTLSKSGQLAFDAIDEKGNYDIYVTKPRSTQAIRLTTDPAEDSAPVYSPDGTKLLFVSARTGDYEIFEMDADGSGQRDVSNRAATAEVAPNFGPATTRTLAAVTRPGLAATAFPCALIGTTGNDNGIDHPILYGDGNANRICGRSGNDIIYGRGGNDLIDAGPGNDTMYGGYGNDTIYARAGVGPEKDVLWGGYGSDIGYYDPGYDVCHSDVEYCRTTA